jgi:hypothetical protein
LPAWGIDNRAAFDAPAVGVQGRHNSLRSVVSDNQWGCRSESPALSRADQARLAHVYYSTVFGIPKARMG